MPEKKYTFGKSERLCSKTIITELFACQGDQVVSEYPYLLKWQVTNKLITPYPAQIVIAIGKRNFKKAVSRNRIRRQIRELYRQRKQDLYEILTGKEIKIAILLIFVGKECPDFDLLKLKFDCLIEKVIEKIKQYH